eukprot:1785276-Prorocentrum_lima.AAC.1
MGAASSCPPAPHPLKASSPFQTRCPWSTHAFDTTTHAYDQGHTNQLNALITPTSPPPRLPEVSFLLGGSTPEQSCA